MSTLGQGGMGEVYEAFDLELHEGVALKTIKHDIASDPRFIERFKHEVQRSRTISHSNVCRVYDLFRERTTGDLCDADVWFLTMELLRGETLSDRLRRDGRMETAAALPLVSQMCDALDAAHGAGVVHRDFKSGNVMLVAGRHVVGVGPHDKAKNDSEIRVVVTDFGLARPMSAADESTFASDDLGKVIGTPAYMAPEQLEGQAATASSDLYALGVVMYEMVTGRRPFVADSPLSAAVQRLSQSPVTPRAHVPNLDLRWEQTILRCLERDPSRRFLSAAEVCRALTGSATDVSITTHANAGAVTRRARLLRPRFLVGAGGAALGVALLFNVFSGRVLGVSSIAVVPFVSDGSDPETEYLSDGLTESLIDSLAKATQPTLKVIAFNSVMRYKGREIDAEVVGHELHVGAVVIGRVAQQPDGLSVSAELVNASDRSHMWGKTYKARLAEVPAVQGEIAEAIYDHLRLRLDGQKPRAAKRHTENVEAYRLYLKGRYFWNKYTEEGWKKAIEYFDQAIAIDPNYAAAWAGVADSYYQLSSIVLRPSEAIPQARAAAEKALAIDEGLAEAHASLGIIKAQYDWDSKGAEKEFKRAIELNANYATAHQWYGMYLFAKAQFDAALVELNKAQELDPLSLIIAVTAVWPLRHLGQDDQAIQQLEKTIEMFPNVPALADYLHQVRGDVYLEKHRYDDAVAEFVVAYNVKAPCGDSPETVHALKHAYSTSGLDGFWRTQLALATRHYQEELDATKKQSSRRYVSPFRLAELHARVGDIDGAFALLQDSYNNRDENLRWLKVESLSVDSPWQSLRPDPRFTALLRNVGLDE